MWPCQAAASLTSWAAEDVGEAPEDVSNSSANACVVVWPQHPGCRDVGDTKGEPRWCNEGFDANTREGSTAQEGRSDVFPKEFENLTPGGEIRSSTIEVFQGMQVR